MKKIIFSFLIIFSIFLLQNKCFALSDDFKFVIDTIGIPRYSVYGDEINEDVYYTYNIFVYSNPLAMFNKTSTQRFKESPNYGKWTKEGTKFSGAGIRGEYYVLGTTYSGSIVDNVYFPVDAIPETEPNNWKFIEFDGALSSWSNSSIYKYLEQLEYMKSTQMLFDSDNFNIPPTGQINLKSYNIIANKIGLNKARLNTASTWKTMGVISTKRINNKGNVRNAIFATSPMAANANVLSQLDVKNNYTLMQELNDFIIPFKFGSEVTNLNNYAKIEHIKEISSTLYINDIEISKISGSKKGKICKPIEYQISRDTYPTPGTYNLKVKVVSYLYTEFSVDGLMKNTIEKDIVLNVHPKLIVPVKSMDMMLLGKNGSQYIVKPLIKTHETDIKKSLGLVENARHIALKIKFDKELKNKDFEVFLNNKKLTYEVLMQTEDKMIIKIDIDKCLPNTLASWNYLRDITNNYFSLDFNKVGNRVKEPNILKIVLKNELKDHEYMLSFDSIDDYLINMNYIFNNKVSNLSEINTNIKLSDWI